MGGRDQPPHPSHNQLVKQLNDSFNYLSSFPQDSLRVSFYHGRDRIRRHHWISPFGAPLGKRQLIVKYGLLTTSNIRKRFKQQV